MGLTIDERLTPEPEQWENSLWQFGCSLRVAIPGIIQSFDAATQTAVVQPAIKETMVIGGEITQVTIDPLLDVPIVPFRAGGFSLTVPVKQGDECLLIFADDCIDGWYQSGGVQAQMDRRRHDLSDAFAILGPCSQPNKLSNYSTTSAQLRTDDGNVILDLSDSEVKVTGGGTALSLVNDNFYQWFVTTFMPAVQYKAAQPAPPTDPETTVLKGE